MFYKNSLNLFGLNIHKFHIYIFGLEVKQSHIYLEQDQDYIIIMQLFINQLLNISHYTPSKFFITFHIGAPLSTQSLFLKIR